MENSEWDPAFKSKKSGNNSNVVIVYQNKEPPTFRAFFLGWGDDYKINSEGMKILGISDTSIIEKRNVVSKHAEPSSAYLREEAERKRLKKLAKAAAVENAT